MTSRELATANLKVSQLNPRRRPQTMSTYDRSILFLLRLLDHRCDGSKQRVTLQLPKEVLVKHQHGSALHARPYGSRTDAAEAANDTFGLVDEPEPCDD